MNIEKEIYNMVDCILSSKDDDLDEMYDNYRAMIRFIIDSDVIKERDLNKMIRKYITSKFSKSVYVNVISREFLINKRNAIIYRLFK